MKTRQISISGNSARYNIEKEEELKNSRFNSLSKVDILDNGTIALYHYGNLGEEQYDDLRRLGTFLKNGDTILAFGFNYTDYQPTLIVIGNKGVSVIPFQIKVSPKYSWQKIRLLDWLSNIIPIDFQYQNDEMVEGGWRDSLRKGKTDFYNQKPLNPSEEMEGNFTTLK